MALFFNFFPYIDTFLLHLHIKNYASIITQTMCQTRTNCFFDSVKLMGYFVSAVIVELSKPCVGPSPRTQMFLFLRSICSKELLSNPKKMTYFALLTSDHYGFEHESNPMSHPCYLYIWISSLRWLYCSK